MCDIAQSITEGMDRRIENPVWVLNTLPQRNIHYYMTE